MLSDRDTFVDKCLRDEIRLEDVDTYVELWHRGHDERELSDFLGLDRREYAAWLQNPDRLALIVAARRSRPAA